MDRGSGDGHVRTGPGSLRPLGLDTHCKSSAKIGPMGFKRRDTSYVCERQRIVDERFGLNLKNRPPTLQQIHRQIAEEIDAFAERLVKKYQDYQGRDLRKAVSHLLEQAGCGIHRDMEHEKRLEREKLHEAAREARRSAPKASSTSGLKD